VAAIGELGGDVDPLVLLPLRLVVEDGAFIWMRSTMPRKSDSWPSGYWIGDGHHAEALAHRLEAHVEVGADLVHLVDERDARHVVLVGLTPDRLALRLDAVATVEHRDRAVEHTQERSTSMVKSTWPGVSMMLMRCGTPWWAPSSGVQKQLVAAEVIVMPRSCSWTIQSMVAAPSWTSPIL
jgi:hypothetical protein